MPPLQALVALHGLWILVLLPVGAWTIRNWQPRRLRLVGSALAAAGLLSLAFMSGREWLTWRSAVSSHEHQFIAQRILYVLGTSTDIPVVQVLVAGIILYGAARRCSRSLNHQPPFR